MSTNKTTNYQLHSWEPGDDFLRSEFNENFAGIDTVLKGKAEIVTGTYTGDGETSRTIELGFTPKAVLVIPANGWLSTQNSIYGGLALPGHPATDEEYTLCQIVEGGFQVYYGSYTKYSTVFNRSSNTADRGYHYLAVK